MVIFSQSNTLIGDRLTSEEMCYATQEKYKH